MYTSKQVTEGALLFAETEILPALAGWKLWVGSAALVLAGQRAEAILQALGKNPVAVSLGLFDQDGRIDVDAAAGAMKAAIRKCGKLPIDLSVLGKELKFAEKDIDTLTACIRQAAGGLEE